MSRRTGVPATIWIGGALLLLAQITFGSTFAALVRGEAHEEQFSVPGTFQGRAQEPGKYYLWNHHKTVFQGQPIKRNKKFPSELSITVKDSQGGEVPFKKGTGPSWSIGNHAKQSIGFIESPGSQTYQIEVSGKPKQNVILSFARAEVRNELWVAFRGFVVALAAGLLGILLLIWNLIFSRKR